MKELAKQNVEVELTASTGKVLIGNCYYHYHYHYCFYYRYRYLNMVHSLLSLSIAISSNVVDLRGNAHREFI